MTRNPRLIHRPLSPAFQADLDLLALLVVDQEQQDQSNPTGQRRQDEDNHQRLNQQSARRATNQLDLGPKPRGLATPARPHEVRSVRLRCSRSTLLASAPRLLESPPHRPQDRERAECVGQVVLPDHEPNDSKCERANCRQKSRSRGHTEGLLTAETPQINPQRP